MGFQNQDLCLEALQKYNGSLEGAIEYILARPAQQTSSKKQESKSPRPQAQEPEYQTQLRQLGFMNTDTNEQAYRMANGNFEQAVTLLIGASGNGRQPQYQVQQNYIQQQQQQQQNYTQQNQFQQQKNFIQPQQQLQTSNPKSNTINNDLLDIFGSNQQNSIIQAQNVTNNAQFQPRNNQSQFVQSQMVSQGVNQWNSSGKSTFQNLSQSNQTQFAAPSNINNPFSAFPDQATMNFEQQSKQEVSFHPSTYNQSKVQYNQQSFNQAVPMSAQQSNQNYIMQQQQNPFQAPPNQRSFVDTQTSVPGPRYQDPQELLFQQQKLEFENKKTTEMQKDSILSMYKAQPQFGFGAPTNTFSIAPMQNNSFGNSYGNQADPNSMYFCLTRMPRVAQPMSSQYGIISQQQTQQNSQDMTGDIFKAKSQPNGGIQFNQKQKNPDLFADLGSFGR